MLITVWVISWTNDSLLFITIRTSLSLSILPCHTYTDCTPSIMLQHAINLLFSSTSESLRATYFDGAVTYSTANFTTELASKLITLYGQILKLLIIKLQYHIINHTNIWISFAISFILILFHCALYVSKFWFFHIFVIFIIICWEGHYEIA